MPLIDVSSVGKYRQYGRIDKPKRPINFIYIKTLIALIVFGYLASSAFNFFDK